MAGIINKKSRLIDYKLTEHGRRQMSTSDICFKYYTFSDKSIVYIEDFDNLSDNKISDSVANYLPTEVTTNPGIYLNPEYYLDNNISFNTAQNNLIFELNTTQNTLSDTFVSKKYLGTKFFSNSELANSDNIIFESIDIQKTFDFKNKVISRKYPSVVYLSEEINNLTSVKKDPRFVENLKFKKMPPINKDGSLLINDPKASGDYIDSDMVKNPIEFIFKTLDIKNKINKTNTREEIVTQAINSIDKNKDKFFYLDYHLNSSFIKENNTFTFELHKINEGNLDKLPFVKIGSFYDKINKKYLDIYLIGKFIKKQHISSNFNSENSVSYIDVSNDYYFINLFTLVIE